MYAKCMAVRTITIDMEAYEALARHKQPGQSFSQVIKQHFGRLHTGRDLMAAVERAAVSEETLDAVDRLVAERQSSPARPESL